MTSVFKKLGGKKFLLLAGLALFLMYSVGTSKPIPNYDPDKGLLYGSEDYVPPDYFKEVQAVIIFAFALILSFSGAQNEAEITQREAEEIVENEINRRKEYLSDPRFQGTFEISGVVRRDVVGQGKKEHIGWTVAVVSHTNPVDAFYRFKLDTKGNIKDWFETEEDMKQDDLCFRCGGKDYDVRPMAPPEMQALKLYGEVMRGRDR